MESDFSPIQNSQSEIFIIESPSDGSEENCLLEGKILYDLLKSLKKNPRYIFFEDKDQLSYISEAFRKSNYRYLHISTHGNQKEIILKNQKISYDKFASYFSGNLKLRRVFSSAGNLENEKFREALCNADNKGMHSVLTPVENMLLGEAISFWSMFYVSLLNESRSTIKNCIIDKNLECFKKLLSTEMFFSSY
ncbi:MAG: hypothetical protein RR889_07225, partial [Akkermansia sp.]